MKPISLTGIKPTGKPHIGNYLGMYRPALDLMKTYQGIYFVADYHALTIMHDPETLRELVYEVAAGWLALGLDPDEAIFFRQSDVPEIPELTWVLSCFTSKGLLNRAHAYKAAVDENLSLGRDPDEGVNAGLFNYPVLMAADILLYGSDVVPVGLDQNTSRSPVTLQKPSTGPTDRYRFRGHHQENGESAASTVENDKTTITPSRSSHLKKKSASR